jgi:ferrochelatase
VGSSPKIECVPTPVPPARLPYDAFLLVSFGGPEKREDVIPFLENVLRGRDVPRERLLAVAEHYYHFGGLSPINQQNRELLAALSKALKMPVYWGNRNWHPLLADTVAQMQKDGVRNTLALATSAFGSYSGCRQYLQNMDAACSAVPEVRITKLRPFATHPLFLEAMIERVRPAAAQLPGAQLVFTAHSIPLSMATESPYVDQLEEASRRVAAAVGIADWKLVYQSRSGPPTQPWLGPDICDYMREMAKRELIIAPIGFISDHMEVLYDLDTEAKALAAQLGITMTRTPTVGTHPSIIKMVAQLVDAAQIQPPEPCPETCCPAPVRPQGRRP